MSRYLIPQGSVDDSEFVSQLSSSPVFQECDLLFKETDTKEITMNEIDHIINCLEENEITVNTSSAIPPRVVYTGYRWEQSQDEIIVVFTSTDSSLSESDDLVSISNNVISSKSGFISGKLYRKPESYEVKIKGSIISIELKVGECKWPILICGGSMDPDSIYILGLASLKVGQKDLAERLFVNAAMKGHILSMARLAHRYFASNEEKKAFYWSVKLFAFDSEVTSIASICDVLFEQEDRGVSARLAESILTAKAKQGVQIAFLYLGYLHMRRIPGFVNDQKLAIHYFEVAAFEHHSRKALETLGKCYIEGVGVEKDYEKGIKMLHEANLKNDEIHSILKKSKEKRAAEKREKRGGGINRFLLTATTCIIVASSLYLGYRFFSRKQNSRKVP